MLTRYRALGADLPFADLRRAHGVGMEGYFWRFSDAGSGRVVIALCGLCRDPRGGAWATLALAAAPGGFHRAADVPVAGGDATALGVWAGHPGSAFHADADGLRVDLGPDARLDVRLSRRRDWARPAVGGSGVAHLIPGLGQYWHPHLLGADVSGEAVLGDERFDLTGFQAYAEKNWGGGGFPPRWWWGQAQGFTRRDVCVAFAGGDVVVGSARLEATGVVVRLGEEIIRLGNPLLAPVRVVSDGEHWSLRGRGPRHGVELHGGAPREQAHLLPVPLLAQRRSTPGALEHLAATARLVVRRRGRVIFDDESPVAGLELGGSGLGG